MIGYVYILKSLKNGKFYLGSTNNLDRRIFEHNLGKNKYTRLTKPFELIFSQKFKTLTLARKIEYKLKSYKSKKILLNIIQSGKIITDNNLNLSW